MKLLSLIIVFLALASIECGKKYKKSKKSYYASEVINK